MLPLQIPTINNHWRYLVKQWQQDGPDRILVIIPNGQTDNIHQAHQLLTTQTNPTHIIDTTQEKIIIQNY